MGTPEFAVPVLKSLKDSTHTLQLVLTKPPAKKNRGQKIIPSPVHSYSIKNNLSVRTPNDLNNEELEIIKKLSPDIIVVVAYGKLIPNEFLRTINSKFINVHASILPKWRGAAPIQRAIMNMDKETGISIMKIIPKLDAGPVMKVAKVKIDASMNYQNLSEKLSKLATKVLLDSLNLIKNKKENFIPQDEKLASYAKKIEKNETKINWTDNANKVIAKINAFNPNPGCWFEMNKTRIKVLKAIEIKKSGKPGEIIDQKFTIGCLNNSIQILELKPEGKKILSNSEFLRGYKLKVGTILNGI